MLQQLRQKGAEGDCPQVAGPGAAPGALAERLNPPSAEQRWGQPVCGCRPRPGRLETDQLAWGKASSSEQD